MKHVVKYALDLHAPTKVREQTVTQNDAIEFVATLLKDGVPVDLDGVTPSLAVKRLDGAVTVLPGTADGNVVTFTLGSTETAKPGRTHAAVQLYDAEGRVSSLPFSFLVVGDLTAAGSIPSENEATLIEVVLQDGPSILQRAETAAATAEQVAAENKTRFLAPVATVAERDATYANPTHGDTVQVTGEAAYYRYEDGAGWTKTNEYDPAAIDHLSQQLAEKASKTEVTNAVTPKADKTYVDSGLNGKLDKTSLIPVTQLDKNRGLIDQTYLTDELKQQIAGTAGINATPADGGILEKHYSDASIGSNKLKPSYNYVGNVGTGQVFTDLNACVKEGVYVVLNTALNRPTAITSTSLLVVHNVNNLYIRQEIYDRYDISKTFLRVVEPNNSYYGQWVQQVNANDVGQALLNRSVGNSKLSDTYNYNGSHSSVSMGGIDREGLYVMVSATDRPIQDTSGFLSVSRYADNIIQEYSSMIYPSAKKIYRRVKRVGGTYSEWFLVSNDPDLGVNKFGAETLVTMGDSITGAAGYQAHIAKRLGMNVVNCGFGGTRMTYHTDPDFDKFSFTKLVDAKISGDFSAQDDAASRLTVSNMAQNLQNWKSIDLTKVHYISIWFGTNDFSGSIYLGEDGSEDTTTLKGAMNYGIRRLLEAFPHLKIVAITPMFRTVSGGNHSDDTPNAYRNLYLRDYADAIRETAKAHHLPCLYMYDESGINKYNHTHYLSDGLHPYLAAGSELVGNKIASFIGANF